MNRSPKKHYITNASQLKQLSSPVRLLIIDAFLNNDTPTSIREIGERINRAPDSLYYHFKALETAGLIQQAGTRIESGKPTVLYRPLSKVMKIKYNLKSSRFKALLLKIFGAALRIASRHFEHGLELKNARGDGPSRNVYMCRMEAWLSRSDLEKINQNMEEIVDILAENSVRKRGERCSVFMSLSPLEIRAPK